MMRWNYHFADVVESEEEEEGGEDEVDALDYDVR